MDPAAPLAGSRVVKRQDPVSFQFTPINGPNGEHAGKYAVVSREGKISWVRLPNISTDGEETNTIYETKLDLGAGATDLKGHDSSRAGTSKVGHGEKYEVSQLIVSMPQIMRGDSLFNPPLGHPKKREQPVTSRFKQALAIANSAVGTARSVGSSPSSIDSPFPVRGPTEITGIFEVDTDGSIQCRVYKITEAGAVLQSVDNFAAFRAVRRSEGFPKFARLPFEVRDMIWKCAMPERRVVGLNAVFPDEDRSEWLLRSFSTSIPGIIQACNESRHLALELLTPAFEPQYAGASGLVTYINFALDTLAISLATAKWMTKTHDPSIIASREKIRGVICFTSTFRLVSFAASVLVSFVFNSSVHSWSGVQTWSFPGIKETDIHLHRITNWVCLEFHRPHNKESAERYIKSARRGIKRALRKARSGTSQGYLVGLRITFTANPSPVWYARMPRIADTLEW